MNSVWIVDNFFWPVTEISLLEPPTLTAAATAGQQAAQSGLQGLQALNVAGTQQQQLDQQALNAQYNEYLRQLQYPQTMLTLNKNMLTGLPMTTTNNFTAAKSASQQLAGGIAGISGIVDSLMGKGFTQAQTADYLKKMFTDSTGKQNLTDAQIQAELDRATAEARSYDALPQDAVPDGSGNFIRQNHGMLDTFNAQGELIASQAIPSMLDDYVPPDDNSGDE